MNTYVVLLRGINVGGHHKMLMPELRSLAETIGIQNARTYIQSGNLIGGYNGSSGALEDGLEDAIEKRFGFSVPVIARTATQWHALHASNPFPAEAEEDPAHLYLMVSKHSLSVDGLGILESRAQAGERVRVADDGLWVYFPNGSARSKLTPAVIDRAAGSPTTARNWRTLTKLLELMN